MESRMSSAQSPAAIEPHAKDYKPNAWEAYSFFELGSWVGLLAKRAEHRTDKKKQAKDLYDANNYLEMMRAKLDALLQKANLPPA